MFKAECRKADIRPPSLTAALNLRFPPLQDTALAAVQPREHSSSSASFWSEVSLLLSD